MAWELRYYLDSRGGSPVDEFIERLPEENRALVRSGIGFLGEIGNRAREPLSKSLGEGLFELRVRACRIFYCFKPGRTVVLLHAFSKKTQKTPKGEILPTMLTISRSWLRIG